MSLDKKLQDCIETVLSNADDDRQLASKILSELINELEDKDFDTLPSDSATGASNLINALQRSNEQIVKIGELIRKYKKESGDNSELDSEKIYKQLEEAQEKTTLEFDGDE